MEKSKSSLSQIISWELFSHFWYKDLLIYFSVNLIILSSLLNAGLD